MPTHNNSDEKETAQAGYIAAQFRSKVSNIVYAWEVVNALKGLEGKLIESNSKKGEVDTITNNIRGALENKNNVPLISSLVTQCVQNKINISTLIEKTDKYASEAKLLESKIKETTPARTRAKEWGEKYLNAAEKKLKDIGIDYYSKVTSNLKAMLSKQTASLLHDPAVLNSAPEKQKEVFADAVKKVLDINELATDIISNINHKCSQKKGFFGIGKVSKEKTEILDNIKKEVLKIITEAGKNKSSEIPNIEDIYSKMRAVLEIESKKIKPGFFGKSELKNAIESVMTKYDEKCNKTLSKQVRATV